MLHTLLMRSKANEAFGLVIGPFIGTNAESRDGQQQEYLVLWEGVAEPSVEFRADMCVAGSVSHAVFSNLPEWSHWASLNPKKAFLEVLAEESLIETGGKTINFLVSDSKLKRRWTALMSSNRPVESYEEVVKWLRIENEIGGPPGSVRHKLQGDPGTLFQVPTNDAWWLSPGFSSIVSRLSTLQPILTRNFFHFFQELSVSAGISLRFPDLMKLCDLAELSLGELSVEPEGEGDKSKAFDNFRQSLDQSQAQTLNEVLALIWGDYRNAKIDTQQALDYLVKTDDQIIRNSRASKTAIRAMLNLKSIEALSDENFVLLLGLACRIGIAVNFREEIYDGLRSRLSLDWPGIHLSRSADVRSIFEFLGFSSNLGRTLMAANITEMEGVFSSEVFWSGLGHANVTPELLESLAKPVSMKSVRPYVVNRLAEAVGNSNIVGVALALANDSLARCFGAEQWAAWISKALNANGESIGSEIFKIISNENEILTMQTRLSALHEENARALEAELSLRGDLQASRSELSNTLAVLEQTRQGVKATLESQNANQDRASLLSLVKVLATVGSLPGKVDPAVYAQLLQQVKTVGLIPIANVGDAVEYSPLLHTFRGDGIAIGESVTVIAPGFKSRVQNHEEIVWKAQVIRN